MRRFLSFLGVSYGDMGEVEKSLSPMGYVLNSFFCSFLRLLANHCIVPSIRRSLFSLSGIEIGKDATLNMGTVFLDGFRKGMIKIEPGVSIAPNVTFVAESHPNNSPLFKNFGFSKTAPILIKEGAWLGTGVVILPGVVVGKLAIIGANCVVTKDVEDFAIFAGNPGKKIGDVRRQKGSQIV